MKKISSILFAHKTALLILLSTSCAKPSLVELSEEAPGSNCTNGGTAIVTGIDENEDGVLQEGEVTDTAFVCDVENPEELPALVEGSLTLENQEEIDLAQNVVTITGDLTIRTAGLASVTLPNLAVIEGQLVTISADGALVSLPELLSAGSISVGSSLSASKLITAGDIILGFDAGTIDFPSLESASRFENFGGSFSSGTNNLTEVVLPSLESLDSLRLNNNDALQNLSAPLLTQITEAFLVTENPQLPTCQAQNLSAQLQAPPVDVIISGNNDQGACP